MMTLRTFACPSQRSRQQQRKRHSGFTLLEVLIVVVIISVLMSFVVLNVRTDLDDQVEVEAKRLAALIKLVQQEAVMQSREMALEFSDDSYGFLVLEESSWQSLADDNTYRERVLPEDIRFDLYINDEPVVLQASDDADEADQDLAQDKRAEKPRVYVLSSGEVTPFEAVLYHLESDTRFHVIADMTGRLELGQRL